MAGSDALNPLVGGNNADIIGASGKQWGFGMTQAIDAAAMVMYIAYKHGEMELTAAAADDACDIEGQRDRRLAGSDHGRDHQVLIVTHPELLRKGSPMAAPFGI